MAIADEVLADYTGNPRVAAFWVPRLARFAAWFAETERGPAGRHRQVRVAEVERQAGAGRAGRAVHADRARRPHRCRAQAGSSSPTTRAARTCRQLASRAPSEGEAPQLPLEAAIAAASGFAGVPAAAVWRCCATSRPRAASRRARRCRSRWTTSRPWRARPRTGSTRLIAEFDREATPYRAVRRARFKYDYDDYAHLARVAEWSGRQRRGGRDMRLFGTGDALAAVREKTRRNQAAAADPATSAWVSANAGTGKTHVLTMRVLRLLLAGAEPAAHPGAHLHQGRRGRDVDARVRAARRVGDAPATRRSKPMLAELLDRAPSAEEMLRARQLFARGHRDAGRPQGADHPRLLRAAAAALPAGGRRAAGLRDPRRPASARRCSRRPSTRCWPRPPPPSPDQPLAPRARRRRWASPPSATSTTLLAEALRQREWLERRGAARCGDDARQALREAGDDLPAGPRSSTPDASLEATDAALADVLSKAELGPPARRPGLRLQRRHQGIASARRGAGCGRRRRAASRPCASSSSRAAASRASR